MKHQQRSRVRQITVPELHAELKAQGVAGREHFAFLCPLCLTAQSAADLIAVGAGDTFDEVEKYVGFSCVGRLVDAGPPRRKPDGKPCNWTLGGFLKVHKLEILRDGFDPVPYFELATPEKAQRHARLDRAARRARLGARPE